MSFGLALYALCQTSMSNAPARNACLRVCGACRCACTALAAAHMRRACAALAKCSRRVCIALVVRTAPALRLRAPNKKGALPKERASYAKASPSIAATTIITTTKSWRETSQLPIWLFVVQLLNCGSVSHVSTNSKRHPRECSFHVALFTRFTNCLLMGTAGSEGSGTKRTGQGGRSLA